MTRRKLITPIERDLIVAALLHTKTSKSDIADQFNLSYLTVERIAQSLVSKPPRDVVGRIDPPFAELPTHENGIRMPSAGTMAEQDARCRVTAMQGCAALLRRQLETGQNWVSSETLKALAA